MQVLPTFYINYAMMYIVYFIFNVLQTPTKNTKDRFLALTIGMIQTVKMNVF